MRTLYGLHYSPWTERARWALDHHLLPFRFGEHLPLAGVPLLRMRARRFTGEVTVPFMTDDAGARVMGSFEIARYAERVGTGARLIPSAHAAAVDEIVTECDAILHHGRARVIAKLRADPEALAETLPPFVPASLLPVLRPGARLTASLVAAKYRAPSGDEDRAVAEMEPMLERLRERLGGRETFFTTFTLADISVAATLQCVKPVAHPAFAVRPATARTWEEPALAERFGDLLDWRDRVYHAHRA